MSLRVIIMKALITGASSGIGYSMAKYFNQLGIDLVLVGRNKEKLEELQSELKVNSKIVIADLKDINKVKDLYILTSRFLLHPWLFILQRVRVWIRSIQCIINLICRSIDMKQKFFIIKS